MLTGTQALLLQLLLVVYFGGLVLSLFELDASGSSQNSEVTDSTPLIAQHSWPPHLLDKRNLWMTIRGL